MTAPGLKDHEFQDVDPEFPDSYDIVNELKSPLNVLWYNLNFEFIDKYPAKIPEDFARDMVKLYSKPGDIVWDGMCGSGTISRIANQLGRLAFGSDVNPAAIQLAKRKDPDHAVNYKVVDVREVDFVQDIHMEVKPSLIFSSPPFGLNIIGDKNNYSDEPKDVSRNKTYSDFYSSMRDVIKSYYRNLRPGGIMILDSRDRQKDGVYHDVGVEFRNMAISCGFEIVCRYWYMLIPYRQMTYKHKPTKYVMPMVAAMDAYIFYRPLNGTLD